MKKALPKEETMGRGQGGAGTVPTIFSLSAHASIARRSLSENSPDRIHPVTLNEAYNDFTVTL